MPSVKGSSAAALRRLAQMEAMVDGQIMTSVASLQSQIDGLELGEVRGEDGKSAYQIWLDQGNTGSEQDFLNALKGQRGEPGPPGTNGTDGNSGQDGTDATIVVGSVTTANPNESAEVINTGTNKAAVLNFKIPRGSQGNQGPTAVVNLGNVVLTQTATVAIALGVRTITVSAPGVVAGETIQLIPIADLPIGYAIHNAVATANNTLRVTLTAPLLAIGASYSITCRVVAFR